MKKALALLTLIFPVLVVANDWPPELINKTYNGCMKNGGKSQCECLVSRLQNQFTFEDIQMSMTNRFARQALQQSINTYNMKCLDADFKKETILLKKQK